MTTTMRLDRPPVRIRGARRVLLDSAYALTAFPISLAAFVVVLPVLATGAGLSVLGVGLALMTLGVLIARGFAVAERLRLRGMLGRSAPEPRHLRSRADEGFIRRVLTPLRDPQSWLDVAWSLVGLVTGTIAFSLVVAWWAAVGGGLTYWYWERFLPLDDDSVTLASLIGLGEGREPEIMLNTGFGVFALLTLPWMMRVAALTHAGPAAALLCGRAELQGQVDRVQDSRDAARVAESASLRRLERDIHDGPQQRLVRLAMDLGRARRQVHKDPERAGQIIEDARRQATETVAELRSLSRGIAPPLLVDRGLAAAVEEMAQGCPVPATVRADVPDGLPPHVETAAYFVVAEALTNVAKHSGAGGAEVHVTMSGMGLVVEVSDDGVGGAHEGKGLGLAGLARRIEAAEGELTVSSPPGGPTLVRACIPVDRR
ncbi:sensor histidine kinase [Actinocorallia populi]|uniref:sensor histidine kinase n=1 Tax=Actinocorallia populi TaxID=2079200 RepID=UPI0018E59707|nr:sensor histidine kinase [Actinocorallia populi]